MIHQRSAPRRGRLPATALAVGVIALVVASAPRGEASAAQPPRSNSGSQTTCWAAKAVDKGKNDFGMTLFTYNQNWRWCGQKGSLTCVEQKMTAWTSFLFEYHGSTVISRHGGVPFSSYEETDEGDFRPYLDGLGARRYYPRITGRVTSDGQFTADSPDDDLVVIRDADLSGIIDGKCQ